MKLFVAQGNNIIWQFVCSPGVQNTKYKILVLKSQLEMSKKSGFQGQKQWSTKFHIKFIYTRIPPYLGNIETIPFFNASLQRTLSAICHIQ